MRKSNKLNKNDKQAIAIVSLIVVVFLLLVMVGIKSRQVDKLDHYVACANICHPKKVDADRSRIHCKCIEEDENGTN